MDWEYQTDKRNLKMTTLKTYSAYFWHADKSQNNKLENIQDFNKNQRPLNKLEIRHRYNWPNSNLECPTLNLLVRLTRQNSWSEKRFDFIVVMYDSCSRLKVTIKPIWLERCNCESGQNSFHSTLQQFFWSPLGPRISQSSNQSIVTGFAIIKKSRELSIFISTYPFISYLLYF